LVWVLLLGCTKPGTSTKPVPTAAHTAKHKNVLLVTLDTTRADCIGAYGSTEVATPNIDALAAEGTRFEKAWSCIPMTLPAHSSMMTGEYPFTHGVRDNTLYLFSQENTTLAELLKAAGWKTAAFIGATILDSGLGLNKGFDNYYDDMLSGQKNAPTVARITNRRATSVNFDFTNWLNAVPAQTGDGPGWFAWVHYYDPHSYYAPPEPYLTKYASNLYLGEIAFMDEALGKVIQELKDKGMYDDTLVIAVADHGEGLGEHNELRHSFWTYDTTLSVPLIVSDPDSRGTAKTDDRTASIIDVFPTILNWCHVKGPDTPALDLLAPAPASDAEPRMIYFESMEAKIYYGWAGLRGVIQSGMKYIHSPQPELYDLENDPKETTNLNDQNPERSKELKVAMYNLADKWQPTIKQEQRTVTPEEAAQLRSLGYLTGGTAPSAGELEKIDGLIDIKTKADIVDKLNDLSETAEASMSDGDLVAAKAKFEELLTYAEVFDAVQNLGLIALQERNEAESIKYLLRACELNGSMVRSWYNLGFAYDSFGHPEDARKAWEQAIRTAPDNHDNIGSHVGLAKYWSQKGDWQQALDHILAARTIDPNSRELVGNEASTRYWIGAGLDNQAMRIVKTIGQEALQQGTTPEAQKANDLHSQSVTQMRQAFDLYDKFLSTGQGTATNYFEASQAAIQIQNFPRALEWSKQSLSLLPPDDPRRGHLEQLIQMLDQTIKSGGRPPGMPGGPGAPGAPGGPH
jgi:arylsulfatase A-like enzyme/Tfp pilus assembly protein PilF